MEITASYFLVFSLIVYQSCASSSINERRAHYYKFRQGIEDNGKVAAAILPKGNNLPGETVPDLRKAVTISQALSLGGLHSCRKCLRKAIHDNIHRRHLHPLDQQASHLHTSGGKPHIDPSSKTSALEPETSKPFKLPYWAIYTLAISGGVLLVIIAATTMYLLITHRKNDNSAVTPWSTGLSGPLRNAFVTGVPSLGRVELATACEDFINVIGTSSDCTFYKGTLSSGVEIAVVSNSVNSAKDWTDRSDEQFRNKISMLSRVNHKNFMNLLGYCMCDEPFTRMMVFEYAPCGSLFEHLHIREAEPLDWPTRLRVVMGVAYCLEHMSQLDPPVMPATLTSSSIYLTDDYAAKVADIELPGSKDDGGAAEASHQSADIVYKFGILLLEVISGRLPFSEDHGLLVLWASGYLDGKRPIGGMADPTLRSSSAAVPDEDLARLCDVVRQCIQPEREKRPGMGEVAALMRGATAVSPEQATPRDSPLWWAQLEIASSVEE